MSYKVVSRAWSVKGLSPAQKLVLVRLADMANDDGVCWPSYVSIARDVEIDVRSVRRIAAVLESLGLLTRLARFNARGVQSSNWLTVLPPDDRRPYDAGPASPPAPGPASAPAPGPASPAAPGPGGPGVPDSSVRVTRTGGSSSSRTGGSSKSLDESSLKRVPEGLTSFQRARVQSGQSVVVDGGTVKAGSPRMERLQALLRSQDAENRNGVQHETR